MNGDTRTALKGVVFVLMGLVAPLAVYVRDGLTTTELISLIVLALGAAATFAKSNTFEWPAAKAVIAVATAVVSVVVAAWTDNVITGEEWAAIALAFFGALSTWLAGHDNVRLGLAPAVAPVVDGGAV
jgi:accessory gene regulator protein AgrB